MFHPAALLAKPEAVPGAWFSFERHAMLAALEWFGRRAGEPLSLVAVPDYMCHEVIVTLRERGCALVTYPVNAALETEPEAVAAALGDARRAAVLVCHFYGRLNRRFGETAGLCRRRGWTLLEDCAHLPYPFPEGAEPFLSDVRLHTFRKLYGVPYGASAVLRLDQEGFNAFLTARGAPLPDGDGAGVLRWAARETLKRMVVAAGVTVRREYRDLSQDPLKPFDRAHPWVERLLPEGEWRTAVERRRANYRRYMENVPAFAGWAEPLEFDVRRDVPYQLLLTLRAGLDPQAFIDFFLARGVSALRGLALHDDVLKRLPKEHPFNRQVSLPLHQDVDDEDVDRVVSLIRKFGNQPPVRG